ncbi:bilirubin oxidase [Microbulbifer sp. A4B17]|uniref:multicopper oxidase family protein n=1 Tax=Microbulbifer sp. A4B17 TaxID=359370 RepID=UPI000D52D038|nr:multicopper oxidase domain-containing protein [Microbulbifer sp. A4B17]AWF81882.1 bilirubin oxidase [Microbulbifer sp. A4B17]
MKRVFLVSIFSSLFSLSLSAQTALTIPPVLTGTTFDLSMEASSKEFSPGITTATAGYNGAYLGPTLIFNSGDVISIDVKNNLGTDTTTHWHGMHVAPTNDGGPHSIINAGETWSINFPVLDTAATMWYHPHLHENTMEQVNMGLAGMILVRDDTEVTAGFPQTYGVDEFPIILQDRSFDTDGQFLLSPFGDTMLINGTLDPFLEVPAQMVRLRILNGSNERAYNIGFSDDRSFFAIGADGGLLESPVSIKRIVLAPGERADVVVDFNSLQGTTVELVSYASELSPTISGGRVTPGGGTPLDAVNFSMLEFRGVAPTADAVTDLPSSILVLERLSEADTAVTRTIQMTGGRRGQPFTLDNQLFDHARIDQVVSLGDIEIWEIENTTNIAHPFHIHDVQFFILDRNGAAPEIHHAGKKDTVLVDAGETVRFITQFDDFADPDVPYMYHCHILLHEDQGMMGQFAVVEP